MEIGKRIRQVRGDKSRKAFGQLIGIVENTLRNYEEGRAFPNSDVLAHICRIFSVDPFWLLLGDDEPAESGSMRPENEDFAEAGPVTGQKPSHALCQRCAKLEKELEQERENSRKKDEVFVEGFKKIEENGELRLDNLKLQMRLDTTLTIYNELKVENEELKARLSLSTAAPGDSTRTNTA